MDVQGIDEEASAIVFENNGDEERLKTSFETGLRMTILILVDTLCFTNLGKLNLIIVVFSSSQFSILPQLPQKVELASKVVKVDSKIIVSLPKI